MVIFLDSIIKIGCVKKYSEAGMIIKYISKTFELILGVTWEIADLIVGDHATGRW